MCAVRDGHVFLLHKQTSTVLTALPDTRGVTSGVADVHFGVMYPGCTLADWHKVPLQCFYRLENTKRAAAAARRMLYGGITRLTPFQVLWGKGMCDSIQSQANTSQDACSTLG